MKEDQYIKSLFEAANQEPPKLLFEEVAKKFEAATATTPNTIEFIKALLIKNINLNIFIMLLTGSAIAISIWAILTPTTNAIEADLQPVSEIVQPMDIRIDEEEEELNSIDQKDQILDDENKQSHYINEGLQTDQTIEISKLAVEKEAAREVPSLNQDTAQLFEIGKATMPDSFDYQFIPNIYDGNTVQIVEEQDVENTNDPEVNFTVPEPVLEEVLFTLRHTYDKSAAIDFAASLMHLGLAVLINPIYNSKGTVLQRFTLRIRHDKGMDWRMKVNGFKTLEMKVFLNEKKQVEMLSYRFNEKGKFIKPFKVSHGKIRTKIRSGVDEYRSKYQTKVSKSSNR